MGPSDGDAIPWRRGLLLAAAGVAAVAAVRLPAGPPSTLVVVVTCIAALPLLARRDELALALLLPLCAIAAADWLTLGLASAFGLAMAMWWYREREREVDDQLAPLRRDMSASERETTILERHLARYPDLQEVCLELGAIRTEDALADVLVRAADTLVPDLIDVQVWLDLGNGPSLRAAMCHQGRSGERNRELIAYALHQRCDYLHRKGAHVAALMQLGEETSSPTGTDQLRGMLAVEFRSRGLEDHLVTEIIAELGRLGGIGLGSLGLINRARALALQDDLTGLFGQHEFLRRLDEQVSQVRRHGDALGVIMCDLDHLKRYNDRYGHAAGDAALQAVARAIDTVVPDEGVACRYGGEEFAILVPFTRGGRIRRLAEDLLQAIRATRPDPNHPDRHLTASLGWAVLGDHEEAWELMRRADEACYLAKDQGRDRVVAARAPDTFLADVEVIDEGPAAAEDVPESAP